MELRNGQKVNLTIGCQATNIKELGRGGQGVVYLVELGGQLANFTYLDYNTNIDISDDAPALYVERYKAKLDEEGYAKHLADNAIPMEFENMEYFDFLAIIIKKCNFANRIGYEQVDKYIG